MKWGLEGGISIDADSGPPRYVLWCCGGMYHQPDTFVQIGSDHNVIGTAKKKDTTICPTHLPIGNFL